MEPPKPGGQAYALARVAAARRGGAGVSEEGRDDATDRQRLLHAMQGYWLCSRPMLALELYSAAQPSTEVQQLPCVSEMPPLTRSSDAGRSCPAQLTASNASNSARSPFAVIRVWCTTMVRQPDLPLGGRPWYGCGTTIHDAAWKRPIKGRVQGRGGLLQHARAHAADLEELAMRYKWLENLHHPETSASLNAPAEASRADGVETPMVSKAVQAIRRLMRDLVQKQNV